MAQLTPGAVQKMLDGSIIGKFRVQVIGTKRIEPKGPSASPRYKVLLSDGEYSTACILATQLFDLASSGQIRECTIIEVEESIVSAAGGNKPVTIIISLSIIQQDVPKIGNPQTISAKASDPSATSDQAQYNGAAYGAPPGNGYGPPPGSGPYGHPPTAAPMAHNRYQHHNQHHNTNPPPPHNPYGAPPPGNGYGPPPGSGPYGHPPTAEPSPYPNHYNPNAANSNPYAAPPGAPQYRPSAGGVIARNEAPATIMPINGLNSYQNRWTIKARVTQKTDIRRYSNAKGEGKFFSFDLLDADGGEIRVVGWNDQCDRFFDQVSAGQVYLLSKASLRNKRGNFNQTKHQFEVHLESNSVLEPVPDVAAIPKIAYSFVPLSHLEDTPAGVVVDVLGVVDSVANTADISRKDGTQVAKRGVNIRDPSGRSVELTLWGAYASDPGDALAAALANRQGGRDPVILAVKGARVGDFNGKTLSTVSSTMLDTNPVDLPEAGRLRTWYDEGGAQQTAAALSAAAGGGLGGGRLDRRICLSMIKQEGLGLGGQPAWASVLAYTFYTRNENYCYPACPLTYNGKQCNKKLTDQAGDGTMWYCERCGSNAPSPEYRFILSSELCDHTDQTWVTAFNEAGPAVMGHSAGELRAWELGGDPRFDIAFRDTQCNMAILKLKISEETYQDESKLRATVVRVDPVNYAQETGWTLSAIGRLERGESAYPDVAHRDPGAVAAGGGAMYGVNGAVQQQQHGMGVGGGYDQQYGGYGGGGTKQVYDGYGAPPPQQQAPYGRYNGAGGGGNQAYGGYGAPPPQQQAPYGGYNGAGGGYAYSSGGW